MLETFNTELKRIIEIIREENYIVVTQGQKQVLRGNCYQIELDPEYESYKDCFVKYIYSISATTIYIDIETNEERKETFEREERRKQLQQHLKNKQG